MKKNLATAVLILIFSVGFLTVIGMLFHKDLEDWTVLNKLTYIGGIILILISYVCRDIPASLK